MLLRTFTLLNKSTASAAQLVYGYPCNLIDFDGNLIAFTGACYLQFIDKATAATTGDVPIKSFFIPAGAAPTNLASIFQTMGPISFSLGLNIGISSTEATFTPGTGTFDIFGEIEEGAQQTDYISGLSTLTISSDVSLTLYSASVKKRVFSITITNSEGVTVYPMIFSPSSSGDGQYPRVTLQSLANGATRTYYFGDDGYTFLATAATAQVILSTTAPTLTASTGLGSTLTAKVKT